MEQTKMNNVEIHKDLKGNKIFNYLIITSCNNNCVKCCFEQPDKRKNPSLKEIKKALSTVGDEYSTVYLTGGEPTLLNELPSVIKELRSHFNGDIHLLTNGRRFAIKRYAERFNFELGKFIFGIPLHSSDPKIFDAITRVKKSFKQTFLGIRNLAENHTVELRIVVHKINYKTIPETAQFILDFLPKVDNVLFIALDIAGNAYKNKEIVGIEISKVIPYLEKALDILDGHFQLNVNQFPACLLSKRYRHLALNPTIEEGEHILAKQCQDCILYGKCGRIWKSYAKHYGFNELRPIKI